MYIVKTNTYYPNVYSEHNHNLLVDRCICAYVATVVSYEKSSGPLHFGSIS